VAAQTIYLAILSSNTEGASKRLWSYDLTALYKSIIIKIIII